jgi:solute:Na+ symporter, SSS family
MLSLIDNAVIFAYSITCIIIAFLCAGKITSLKEYALGGRYSDKILTATFFATSTGAATILGSIEKINASGLLYAIIELSSPLAWLSTAFIFSRNISFFKNKGCLSITDIMQLLYGKIGGYASNILSTAMTIGVLAIHIKAIGYVSLYFLGVSELHGAIIGLLVIVIYSYFGGVRAVIFTDALQAIVFLVGIPAACFTAFYSLGGYTQFIESIPAPHKVIELTNENILTLGSCFIFSIIPFTEVAYVQRFLIAEDIQQLKRALYNTFLLLLPFYLILILTGFITIAISPESSSKLAFFDLITNHLPIGIKGLVVAGLIAAIMSTADSFLNSASVMFAHNIVRPLLPKISEKTELQAAKFGTILLSIVSFILAYSFTSIVQLIWIYENCWPPFIIAPLVAGFFRFYTTEKSFIVSLLFAASFLILSRYVSGQFNIFTAVMGMTGSAIGLIVGHYSQGFQLKRGDESFFIQTNHTR